MKIKFLLAPILTAILLWTIWIPLVNRSPVIQMSQPPGEYTSEYLGLFAKSNGCHKVFVESIPYWWQYHNECNEDGTANLYLSLGEYTLKDPVIDIDGKHYILIGEWKTGVKK